MKTETLKFFMLFLCDELIHEICCMADVTTTCRLVSTSQNMHRACFNSLVCQFKTIFGVSLTDPLIHIPKDQCELARLIKRTRPVKGDDRIAEVFSYACAAGYAMYVRSVLVGHGESALNNLLSRVSPAGYPPMILAIANNRDEIVMDLVGARVDVDSVDSRGRSALWYACDRGNYVVVTALIRAGARLDGTPSPLSGLLLSSMISWSAVQDGIRALYVLANSMLDALDACFIDFDPFEQLVIRRISEYASVFLNSICLSLSSKRCNSVLMLELMSILRSRSPTIGEFVRSRSHLFHDDPPLYVAASHNRSNVLEGLIASGLSCPNDSSRRTGKSALYIASEKGHRESVAVLLSLKASVDAVTSTGRNCLHAAVEKGQTDIVELLCDHATTNEIMQLNSSQISPFTLAENKGRSKMVVAMLNCYKRTANEATVSAYLNSKVAKYLTISRMPPKR